MHHNSHPPVLIVGNFVSAHNASRGVCEELALRLTENDWQVLTVSTHRGRVARLLDMTTTAWRKRRKYDVAQIAVFSGPAFLWAESVC